MFVDSNNLSGASLPLQIPEISLHLNETRPFTPSLNTEERSSVITEGRNKRLSFIVNSTKLNSTTWWYADAFSVEKNEFLMWTCELLRRTEKILVTDSVGAFEESSSLPIGIHYSNHSLRVSFFTPKPMNKEKLTNHTLCCRGFRTKRKKLPIFSTMCP